MLTLIEDVRLPGAGRGALLLVGDRIAAVGAPPAGVASLGLPLERFDGRGCLAVPGFIDPHEHLIGAGGEQGFGTRMPEIAPDAIAAAGITTVVGCLGTDDSTRGLPALVGKARALGAAGLTALVYTGGFHLPPRTITGSVQDDLVLLDLVIGVGELAISDVRSSQPSVAELARVVAAAYVGGRIAGKAGVTHLHLGPGRRGLEPVFALLDEHDVEPEAVYVTHANRTDETLEQAARLSARGVWIDLDCVDPGVGAALARYLAHGGRRDRLTLSSDAHTPGSTPANLHRELVRAHREQGMSLPDLLPLVTANPAAALKLAGKGRLAPGADADVVLLDERDLEVAATFAAGRCIFRRGGS
jgi:beta-aspartyl-dipeptidase (metallo-type)